MSRALRILAVITFGIVFLAMVGFLIALVIGGGIWTADWM